MAHGRSDDGCGSRGPRDARAASPRSGSSGWARCGYSGIVTDVASTKGACHRGGRRELAGQRRVRRRSSDGRLGAERRHGRARRPLRWRVLRPHAAPDTTGGGVSPAPLVRRVARCARHLRRRRRITTRPSPSSATCRTSPPLRSSNWRGRTPARETSCCDWPRAGSRTRPASRRAARAVDRHLSRQRRAPSPRASTSSRSVLGEFAAVRERPATRRRCARGSKRAADVRRALPAQWVPGHDALTELLVPMIDRPGVVSEITTAVGTRRLQHRGDRDRPPVRGHCGTACSF